METVYLGFLDFLQEILREIFNAVLMPVLKTVFNILVSMIGELIITVFSGIFLRAWVILLRLIDFMEDVFSIFSGMTQLTINGELTNQGILQYLFGQNEADGQISYSEDLGDYAEEMENLCNICKKVDPEDRFHTIEEVEGHLRRIKTQLIQQPKAKRRTTRRLILIGLTALMVILILGGIVAYNVLFKAGDVTCFDGRGVAKEDGIEISFSCVNRGDSTSGDTDKDYLVAILDLGFNYTDHRENGDDKTKARNYQFEFRLQQQSVASGEYLKDQKYTITWDEIRTAMERADLMIMPDEISLKNLNAPRTGEGEGKVIEVSVYEWGTH